MKITTLKALLDINNREELFKGLILKFRDFTQIDHIIFKQYETSEGPIPCIFIKNNVDSKGIKYVKVFISAQHNEFNGLFGTLEFLNHISDNNRELNEILSKNQDLIFFPIMNPYGFLNPSKNNKFGYFLKNGTNLNRFWRRTFAPEHPLSQRDSIGNQIPEHAAFVKKVLQKYWDNEKITIYILDFHETSLLDRFSLDLLNNFSKKSIMYKFNHWLKEGIILNVIKLYNINYHKKPLFKKKKQSDNYTQISISSKQLDFVYEKLQKYISNNSGKLPFYFLYSDKSKNYCLKLAKEIYEKLKDNLWETYYPAFNHNFIDHGCFVKMSDATPRKNIYTMEIESQKQFFNLFEEYEKSNSDPDYFENKLRSINLSIKLAHEAIKKMINLF